MVSQQFAKYSKDSQFTTILLSRYWWKHFMRLNGFWYFVGCGINTFLVFVKCGGVKDLTNIMSISTFLVWQIFDKYYVHQHLSGVCELSQEPLKHHSDGGSTARQYLQINQLQPTTRKTTTTKNMTTTTRCSFSIDPRHTVQ